MIGIKDTLELTAKLHEGRRLADRVRIAENYVQSKTAPGTATATTKRQDPKHQEKGRLIALPRISDELARYRTTGFSRNHAA